MSDGDGNKENPKQKKNPETYIRETEDLIVDLADPDAFSRITSKRNILAISKLMNNIFFSN